MVDNSAELIARLEALEQRVLQLEHPSAVTPVPPIVVETKGKKALTSEEVPSLPTAGGTFPVLGKALLGMAGAYLLRAVADSGTIPKLVVVVLAILYAGAWLVGAARVRRDRIFASTTFAFTSALILAPMLWELTVRFEVFRPALSAGVLGAFAIAALALTWQKPFPAVLWVAYATSMLTSLVLMIAVEDLVPFVCAFLAISFVSEVAAILGHESNARTFAAVVLDCGVAALLYIYSMPVNARDGYGNVGAAALVALASAPFLLYFASTTLQSVRKERRITVLEMLQTVVTFSLAAYAVITFSSSEWRVAADVLCVGIAGVGYAVAFARFRGESMARNFRAYTAWSATLLLLGTCDSLPLWWFVFASGIAAITATAVGARRLQPALEFQGAAFLLAAAGVSGVLGFDGDVLAGPRLRPAAWIFAMVLAFAVVCYGLGGRLKGPGWRPWLSNLLSAAIASGTVAAFGMVLLAKVFGHKLIESSHVGLLDFLQTLTLCALALGLAIGGCRARRQELVWLSYGALVVTAAKILREDVRHGNLIVIAASFVLYAATLIVLPRLATYRSRELVGADV